jgi:excisionase family DNA binding protein
MNEILVGDRGMQRDEMLTAEEVAKIMKVHITTVRKWIRSNELKVVEIGIREYRIRRSELVRFIQARERERKV